MTRHETQIASCMMYGIMTHTKISSLLCLKLLQVNSDILKDRAKYTMIVSKALLYVINLWPEKYGIVFKASFIMMFITCATMEISLVLYLLTSIENVNSLTKVISSIAVCLQSMTKMSIMFFRHKDLTFIIKMVWYEFWPSNTMGTITENHIKTDSKRLLLLFFVVYGTGCMFLLLLIIGPAIIGVRKLPYSSWYPFDWSTTPTYEILYTIQVYVAIYIIANTVCGYDFLYCSICANCVAQYRLLNEAIKYIGSGREEILTDFLFGLPGVNYRPVITKEYEDARKLLVICVNHHQKLIKY
ncbi:odorant receptor [Holotrichia oblita]|uniref:Odorant receptor n=1 Tax=Holotrichia oblita TaxID=644536 RepID=A0ACB9SQL9_HOLOL|nr:odorant receptor [Holotrichia oblita]